MFKDKGIATSVREHMANVIWILTASGITSPISESSKAEQKEYDRAVSEICELIQYRVIDPIERKHPDLFEQKHVQYKKHKFRRPR